MLMLSRKPNESILIGEDIRVIITKISRGRVQIAVEAPRDVNIRREELNMSGSGPSGPAENVRDDLVDAALA